ncbi:MAG: S49 family peptidase, partial [Muribaculaceae bacterium]|nr:S49 family peptidase [Muribaculaceae bacterium]
MLKKFFLNTLSSFVGTWLAVMLFGVVLVLLCIGAAARFAISSGDSPALTKHSIMTVELSGIIEERESSTAPDYAKIMSGDFERPQNLNTLVLALREAAVNKNIDALYLKCGALSAGPATLDALRKEIVEFSKSGKKIYAYGDMLHTGSYYVASAADSIFLNPYGGVDLKGLYGTSLYMKSLFDKIGVSFQVVKVGTFKSAVEPYIMDKMSEPAKAQLDTLFGNMWGYIKDGICAKRKKLTPEKIDSLINKVSISFASAETTVSSGLVDRLAYERT